VTYTYIVGISIYKTYSPIVEVEYQDSL